VRFQPVRRRLRSVHLAAGCIAALGVLAAGLLLADGVDRLHSLREPWALWGAGAAAALACGVLLRAWLRAVLRGPSTRHLALDVERARPELMDSLVCAVELEDRKGVVPNPIEQALLAQVQSRLEAGTPVAEVFRQGLRWRRLLLPAAVFAACLALALHSRAWRKAVARLGDVVRGEHTGLVLSTPAGPVPEHTDVRLEAEVRRWEADATIEYVDADGRHRFRMNRADGDRFFFTLYDVTGSIRYRVLTPALATPWQRLDTYRPPRFEAVSLRTEPPAYTGQEVQETDGFRDLQAVEGSRVRVHVRTQPGVAVEWRTEDATQAFALAPDGSATHEFILRQDVSAHVLLRSPEGRETAGPDVRLVAQPDLPPVVTLLTPPRDLQAKQEETIPMVVRAGDDFGLRRLLLTYAVSGAGRQSVLLFEAGAERVLDRTVEHGFDLGALQVQPGDVVTYAVSALDNREPEAQEARTEVCFIVIRPDLEDEDQEGNQGQEMKLDISALIAESKRLIRLTWDILGLPEAERSKLVADLHRDLNVLRLEVRKTFTKIMQMSGGMIADPLPELFGAAEREIAEAIRLAEQSLLDDAIGPQERGLTALIRIENELLRNAMKSQGKGEDSSSKQEQKPPAETAEQRRSQQQLVQALRDARRKVQELAERQSRLNQEMESSTAAAPEAAKGLADKQRSVGQDAAALAQDLAALPETGQAATSVEAGAGEMAQGSTRLDRSDVPTAHRHGRRASGLLDAAIKDLDEALRKAAGDRIRALAEAAEALSESQRGAAETSRELAAQPQADAEALGQAEARQRELNQAASQLRQAVGQAAAELEESFPDASQELAEALGNAARKGLERSMDRAANALLYRKPERAVRPQTDAANHLLEFARGLERASGRLPALSRDELLEVLQAMQRQAQSAAEAMRQPGETGRQQLQVAQERGAETLDPVAVALKDQTLKEVAEQMAAGIGDGSAAEAGEQTMRLFRAAIGLLERHVMAADVRRRLDLSRRTALPPEKYRQEVEQYFRDLGREP
jgi:hypothetical protein